MNKSFLSEHIEEPVIFIASTGEKMDRSMPTEVWICGYKKERSSFSDDLENKRGETETFGDKEKLLAAIRGSSFEPSTWTRADDLFESMVHDAGSFDQPMKMLSDIVNRNLTDEHVLEGVLHILSNYQYDEINPIGITIAIACRNNLSPIVQDLLITCFEKWDSYETIAMLEELDLKQKWLSDYRDAVIEQIKEGC